MKLLHFYEDQSLNLGIHTDKGIVHVKKAGELLSTAVPGSVDEVVKQESLSLLQALITEVESRALHACYLDESGIQHGCVVQHPQKIICIGLNYRRHAKEINMEAPKTPVLFSKFNNTLGAHNETVYLPHEAVEYDYEAELAIVMGRKARNVSEEEALSHVFGYCNSNDISARDLQMLTGQWLIGKTLDGFAPMGPYLVTRDEVPDPDNLKIQCVVNGELRQSSNTNDMIFSCAQIISYISKYMTLLPGDVILTGTPEGVVMGYPETERRKHWLKFGDEVSVVIERLGELRTVFKS